MCQDWHREGQYLLAGGELGDPLRATPFFSEASPMTEPVAAQATKLRSLIAMTSASWWSCSPWPSLALFIWWGSAGSQSTVCSGCRMIYGASTQVKLSSQNEVFGGNRAELWGLEWDQTKSVKGRGRLNQSLFAELKMKSHIPLSWAATGIRAGASDPQSTNAICHHSRYLERAELGISVCSKKSKQ